MTEQRGSLPAIGTFGRFELRGRLAVGGMAEVYLARERIAGGASRRVVIKRILPHVANDERFVEMFFNEAHTSGRLRHPNIVQMFDAGVDGDACYIVMELVDNAETLRHYCRPKNLLPYKRVLEIIFICAKTLDYAHRKGVIHRDIKPSNILLTQEGTVKISDFSIAHLMTADTANTLPTGFVGSPRYMSPEQVNKDPAIDARTDIYSLGTVLYEILCGETVVQGDKVDQLIADAREKEPLPPSEISRLPVPPLLESTCMHCIRKDPESRIQTASELVRLLQEDWLQQL
jgi:serine/threonine-protein kinase